MIESNQARAAYLSRAAQSIAQHPHVKHFRNTGMIWAFDVDAEDATFTCRFYQASLERELLLRPIGNTVYFMPPYIIDDAEIDFLVAGTCAALDTVLKSSRSPG